MVLKYPLMFIGITQGYNEITHPAIDLAWHNTDHDPIYACGDGVVTRVYYFEQGGNTLEIKYDNGYSSSFMHIRDNTITVKVGDRVTFNQQVAQIGNTGTQTTGPHLHVIIRDPNGSRVDPTTILYVYPDQTVSTKDKDTVLYYNPINYVGEPVERDITKNQIEIIKNVVNCRETPSLSGKILGYIRAGIYNYTNTQEADGYTWYQVGENMWVAYNAEWAILYPKQSSDCTEYQQMINELNNQLNLQRQEIENLNQQIEVLKEQCKERTIQPLTFIFECPEDGLYAVPLNKGERLYVEKM